MTRIRATRCHFVRCVNPNRDKQPNAYDPPQVAGQLRCAGVLHAVRLARAGYPARFELPAFCQIFAPLLLRGGAAAGPSHPPPPPRELCLAILDAALPPPTQDPEHSDPGYVLALNSTDFRVLYQSSFVLVRSRL